VAKTKRGFIDTPHGQIHYRAGGDGPAVVVLHTTAFSSHAMLPLIEALIDRGLRGIGIDTMGLGDSDRPPKPYTSHHEYAQSVVWLIHGLGYQRVHLFGLLASAQIAMTTAADFPEAVETLILQEPFNWGTPTGRVVYENLHGYFPRDREGRYLLVLWHRVHGEDLREREARFRELLTVNDDLGAEVHGKMGWEGAPAWSIARTNIWRVTPRIQAPTLVTYLPDSPLQSAYDQFLATLPRGQGLLNAPSAMREPAKFAEVMVDFIQSVSSLRA